jgi:hypothetical protein
MKRWLPAQFRAMNGTGTHFIKSRIFKLFLTKSEPWSEFGKSKCGPTRAGEGESVNGSRHLSLLYAPLSIYTSS